MISLEFKDLVFGYEEKIILNGVNLKFDEPGLVCILGPNGVGKTTLVKCGNKLLKPSSGEALLDGRDVSEYGLHELAKKTYFNYVNNEKKPGATSADCADCGYCESKCPQHLQIRQLLKKAEAVLESL